MSTKRILVVEDEDRLRNALVRGLREEGYDAAGSPDGEDGLRMSAGGRYDCLVLDWMLPGRDGLGVLAEMRAAGDRTPCILLTARRAVEDRVAGLDGGADDFLTKPFAFAELLARIRACIRRAPQPAPVATVLESGDLRMDLIGRRVHAGGREVSLTVREFALLEHLVRRRGEVVSRAALALEVWRDPAATMTNVIDVYVRYVRGKIGDTAGPRRLRAVRGQGYCWEG